MSKKTITFRNPSKPAAALAGAGASLADAHTEDAVDRWIHRPEAAVETGLAVAIKPEAVTRAPTALTISISAEPDWFEVVKLWFLLPYLTLSFWTLGAGQRSLQHFIRPTERSEQLLD